jgi:hypothetical protein
LQGGLAQFSRRVPTAQATGELFEGPGLVYFRW